MPQNNFNNLSNKKLVESAGKTVIGTPSGLEAQHAQAELTKRLMDSINSLNKSTSRYSDRLLDLTILLFMIAFIQLLVSLGTISTSWKMWIWLMVVVTYVVYYMLRILVKEREKREYMENRK